MDVHLISWLYITLVCASYHLSKAGGMRIAIVVNGSRGDVQPMVAIAQKLQEHGHEAFRLYVESSWESKGAPSNAPLPQNLDLINLIRGLLTIVVP